MLYDGTGTCPVNPICQPGAVQGFTQTGGGGCTCEVSRGGEPPPLFLLALLALVVVRRRR